MGRVVLVVLLCVSVLIVASAQASTTGWGRIGPFSVGMLKKAAYYAHGTGTPAGFGETRYTMGGGTAVEVTFVRGRVTSVGCGPTPRCPAGLTLPDGVTPGLAIPYGKSWRGYILCDNLGSYQGYNRWIKYVHAEGRRLMIDLTVYHGKVISILEWPHLGCGA